MEGGGKAPEPVDRGGAALPRRVDPQVPRRQRGYYIGGAGRDVDGYFALATEEDYGGVGGYFDPTEKDGGDGRGYFAPTAEQDYGDGIGGFAPAPEQVYGGAGRFVGEDLAPLAERILLHVPRPVGSPGRGGNLPLAPVAAPPPLIEGALGRATGPDEDRDRGGNQQNHHGEVDDDTPRVHGGHHHREVNALGDVARGGQHIHHLPVGGANRRPRLLAEPDLVPLRANRNHLDSKGAQLSILEKRNRTDNEFANATNEDLLDLIASLHALKKEFDAASKDDKYAAKKLAKAYKGALAKAIQYQRAITRAGGVPQPIPTKLMILPSP